MKQISDRGCVRCSLEQLNQLCHNACLPPDQSGYLSHISLAGKFYTSIISNWPRRSNYNKNMVDKDKTS